MSLSTEILYNILFKKTAVNPKMFWNIVELKMIYSPASYRMQDGCSLYDISIYHNLTSTQIVFPILL